MDYTETHRHQQFILLTLRLLSESNQPPLTLSLTTVATRCHWLNKQAPPARRLAFKGEPKE